MIREEPREYRVYFPFLGLYEDIRVMAKSDYEAKVRAAIKLGLLKPGIPRSLVISTARIRRDRGRYI